MATPSIALNLAAARALGIGVTFACGSEGDAGDDAPMPAAGAAAAPSAAPDYRVNSLAFSDDGKLLYAASNDGVVAVADALQGQRLGEYHVKDVGCRLIQATHADMHVLHAASAAPTSPAAGQIMYHDLNANKALRHFRHSARVTSLAMNPSSDTFLSVSLDSTFKTWDLRSPTATGQGQLNLPREGVALSPYGEPPYPVGSFDNRGDVFAIALPSRAMSLYNFKELLSAGNTDPSAPFSGVPFDSLPMPMMGWLSNPVRVPVEMGADFVLPPPYPTSTSFTSLNFSPDGRFIALATADRGVILLDAMKPSREYALLNAHPIEQAHTCGCSWSPDSRLLAVGGADGHVWVYDVTVSQTGLPPSIVNHLPSESISWRSSLRTPTAVIAGEAHKSRTAFEAAHAASKKHRDDVRASMVKSRAEKQALEARVLGPPRRCNNLTPPFAASMEEMVSRHESPVCAVAWHPLNPVLASAARTVALWTLPPDYTAPP